MMWASNIQMEPTPRAGGTVTARGTAHLAR